MIDVPDFALFLDFESVDTEFDTTLLEVGAIMVGRTDGKWTTRGETSALIEVADLAAVRADCAPIVDKMHTESGLWAALEAPDAKTVPVATIDRDLAGWVRSVTGGDPIPLGGSGVGHFDRHVIRRQLPNLDACLTYWTFDVGVSRRLWRAAGVEYPDAPRAHRALPDARQAASEFLWQMDELPKTVLVPRTDIRI